jgi:hypothetical protein
MNPSCKILPLNLSSSCTIDSALFFTNYAVNLAALSLPLRLLIHYHLLKQIASMMRQPVLSTKTQLRQ